MVHKSKTKQKILDVAETLFAEQGFNDTSLRAITGKADVNLASVNYHFGDKKTLVRAVLDRYLEAFMPAFGKELQTLEQKSEYTMQQVFCCFKKPLLQLDDIKPNGASRFMLLIGRGYADVQGHLRWFITTRYNDVLSRFIDLTIKANPNLSPETLFWRLHFTLGAGIFTMASSQALSDIAYNDYGQTVDTSVVIDQLIPYLAAGLAAD